jgi:cytochrome c peroxidase
MLRDRGGLGIALLLITGCAADFDDTESLNEPVMSPSISADDAAAGVTGWSDHNTTKAKLQTLTSQQRRGRRLFFEATFGGNGRTCNTCHPSAEGQSGQLSLAEIQARFAADPEDVLFQHDAADADNPNTFNRFLAKGTFLIPITLAANVSIVGSSDRTVVVPRNALSTMNSPALDPLIQWDAREATLQTQARGAIGRHMQSTNVNQNQLDAIAAFERTLFDRDEVEAAGRALFTPDGPASKCGWCHAGPLMNEISPFFFQLEQQLGIPNPAPPGTRFQSLFLDEALQTGAPILTYRFTMPDGSTLDLPTSDAGRAMITGDPNDFGNFKMPMLWGLPITAPYHHSTSSDTIPELVDVYQTVFLFATGGLITFTPEEQAGLRAWLPRL